MRLKHSRSARSWLRSFLYFVFSRCGRSIVRHILPVFLCCLVVALPATVQSFAASVTEYDISDFDVSAFTIGQGGADYSSTVAYEYNFRHTHYNENFYCTAVYNTNSSFYSQGLSKNEMFFRFTDLNISDEYNLNFSYAMLASVTYSISVDLVDMNNSNSVIANVYTASYDYTTDRDGVYTCNVNFTLSNLGVTSNQGIGLLITVIVPQQFSAQYKFGFGTITFTNLDDDSGFMDGILNWLSRIYHSIAGGTDREGVNHEGIVQGIKNGLNSLGSRIGNFFTTLGDNLSGWFTDLKDSIINKIQQIKQWFIDLGNDIIDGLKSLFIPSDGYFSEKKTQLENFVIEHFGALYQGPDVMIDLIRKLLTVNPSANPGITMPAIEFDFQGQHYTLTESIHYSFSWVNDNSHPLYYFYHIYRGFVTVILFVGFGNYLVKKYRNVFEGGGDGD